MMTEQNFVCFKFQNYADIKSQCLKERQLFVDSEFTSEVALEGHKDIESEPEKNPKEPCEEDKSSENDKDSQQSSPIRRVPKCLPLSIRNQQTNLQSESAVPQTPPPVYSPLPPKLSCLPSSELPTIPQNTSPIPPSSSTERPALPRYQSVDGDIIEWRRARDLHHNPRFVPADISLGDCVVGRLADCGVAASLAALVGNKELFEKIVPAGQGFDKDNYAGVFHFRFWHHGEWTDVVVDDFLPTVDDKPVYLHSKDGGIFWAPLLEKAYAKLTGCYSDLEKIPPLNVMVDLTEGEATTYDLLVEDSVPDDLFWKLRRKLSSQENHHMATLSVWKKPSDEDTFEPHKCSYTLLNLVEVYVDGQEWPVRLAKLRSPHDTEKEWKDSEEDWKKVSEEEKERMGLDWLDDGEFFMPWKHIVTRMYKLSMVEIKDALSTNFKSMSKGMWEKDRSAGGANKARDSYGTNPQFKLFLPEVDKDAFMASCLISLMQFGSKEEDMAIGFSVYRCPVDVKGRLSIGRIRASTPVLELKCEHSRDVQAKMLVEPGYYIIVPFTFETNQINTFTIRVLSQKNNELVALDDLNGENVPYSKDPNNMEKPTRRHQVEELERRSRRHEGKPLSVEGWGERISNNRSESSAQRQRRIVRELLRREGRLDDYEETSDSDSDSE